jgi:hypothetical protein
MVVYDLHLIGITVVPDEADTVLPVNADAPLSRSIPAQRLQPVAGWMPQVIQLRSIVELAQLAFGSGLDTLGKSMRSFAPKDTSGISIAEAADHPNYYTLHVNNLRR